MSKSHTIHDLVTVVDNNNNSAASGSSSSGSIGTTNGLQDVLYLKEPGSADLISMGDINQGQLGDCFLLSSLGEVARQSVIQDNLYFISSMIQANANGTETVKLWQSVPGSQLSGFRPVYETVSNSFSPAGVNNGVTQDVVGTQKEIWPQVIEKAFAQLSGGYSAIANGGYPTLAMEALTGEPATSASPVGLTLTQMMAWSNNNDLLTFDTFASAGLPDGLVSDHSYMFAGYSGTGSATKIMLNNPWGFDQPSPISLSQIAAGTSGIDNIDIGHFTFGAGRSSLV